ncbi:Hypothetical predicted protein [Olea europaea subsp. europaea]|uniref:Uncharacterized protein n=1 Tax=Olea europaea subsp. europaea TaxID=158383 RepID=A0A8S0V068_OLEEU|nr:Hypothetical predicted protein [Olea europaea subsp. europaea]
MTFPAQYLLSLVSPEHWSSEEVASSCYSELQEITANAIMEAGKGVISLGKRDWKDETERGRKGWMPYMGMEQLWEWSGVED